MTTARIGPRVDGHRLSRLPLYLTEADVEALVTPADAVEAIEGSLRRLAAGNVENRPRYRVRLEDGRLAVMSAADLELGFAGAKVYTAFAEGTRFLVALFRADEPELTALIEADKLGQLRTGAASGVAARYLAREGASTLGIFGCGWQARGQVAAMRAAVPGIERVVAHCRTKAKLRKFCSDVDAEPAEDPTEVAAQEIVVAVTNSRDPVLRGEWLEPGALVCAVGANVPQARELDNVVLERAVFVCCDSIEQAKLESGDLIEPTAGGVLDWLEVHELQEVVAGEVSGRSAPDDIVLFKSNGLAAWDVALGASAVERALAEGRGVKL
jgi:alanine dehydrogenase